MDSNSAELLEAFERATVQLKFCPNRVWAVAGEDLPNLLPHVETHGDNIDKNKHELCTFDFCEYSRRDFTAVPQRCECGEKDCRQIGYRFPRNTLDEAAGSGKSTVWKLTGFSMLEHPRPYMAVSHVWSDGTGAGSWREGEVNECLYEFFRGIAEQFECEGIWWDTICIPRQKAARTEAIRKMHINYQYARVTVVHDLFLRNWEWDPKTACFAILMSPWFSRGWTALELAQSPKVKVIFKGPCGPVIKDLDEEILSKENGDDSDEHEIRRRNASQIIRNLRRKITSVNELLTVLGSRYTSWPKDLSMISALLVDVKPDESQQNTYMRIVRKLAKVSPGHLFHNAATMSGGSSWCPTSLFSMPLDSSPRSSLTFSDIGIEGRWQICPMEKTLERNFVWTGSHPLIRHLIQDTLKKYPGQCLLLAECGSEAPQRALLVRILSEEGETCQFIRCQYIGAVHLRNEVKFEKVGNLVIVHSDSLLLKQEEQTTTSSRKNCTEDLREAIWKDDYAAFTELVGQVDLNDPDELGRHPLHLAAERGQQQMVRDLLHHGADLNARTHNGQTVFHHAAWGGSAQIVKVLKDQVDEMARDNTGDTALHIAARMGFSLIAEILINDRTIDTKGSNDLTPLHLASMNGDMELVSLLKDANVASRDRKFGWTPLHCAAGSGNEQLVKFLIDHGAQVEAQDQYLGWTPLHFAAINGHAPVVEALFCHDANINIKDKYGWTPLNFAKANEHGEVIELLKNNGASFSTHNAEIFANGNSWTLPHCMAINNERHLIKRLFTSNIKLPFDRSAPRAPIQVAAENGLETTIRKILRNGTSSLTALTQKHDTPLHWAARHGYERLAHVLLKLGADSDKEAKSDGDQTPLHCAAEGGHEGIVRLLLNAGINKEAKTYVHGRALHLASRNGHEAVVRLLLDAGADKQAQSTYNSETPLFCAAGNGHKAIVRVLLDAGAEKDARTSTGQTPLHFATEKGQEATVRLLLEAGADKGSKDKYGLPPLHLAAQKGHEDIVRLLITAGARKEARTDQDRGYSNGKTPLHFAAEEGHEAIVRLMLEAGTDKDPEGNDGHSPLYCAAENGHEAIVRVLLKAGANMELKEKSRNTPLHCAATKGHKAIVRLLVDVGADKEAKDSLGHTPLQLAAQKGHEAIVFLLLETGADKEPESTSKFGSTSLQSAAFGGCEAFARLLLETGTDKEAKTHTGISPLHLAAREGHKTIVRLLLDVGADKETIIDDTGETPLHLAAKEGHDSIVRLFLETGANKESKNKYDDTPLHVAAQNGHEAIVRLLMGAGVDKEARDKNGRTPLHLAANEKHDDIVRLLLEAGVDKDSRDRLGWSPLHCTIGGRETTLCLLLEAGVDKEARSNDGYTALQLATERGYGRAAHFLIEAGADQAPRNKHTGVTN